MKPFVTKIKKNKYEKISKEYLILGYKESEKVDLGNYYQVTFICALNNEELSKCLKEYKLYKKQEIPSIVPLFIFVPIVFILLSIFLICFLKDKNNFDLYFFCLLLPALMIFVVVSIYSIYRMYKINNFINKGEAIQKEILNNAKKR